MLRLKLCDLAEYYIDNDFNKSKNLQSPLFRGIVTFGDFVRNLSTYVYSMGPIDLNLFKYMRKYI
jgi:hypothetical protein